MSVSFARGLSAVSLIAISSSTGWADVTPQDVWSEWKSYMTEMGYEISGQETQSGGTLTVSDMSMAMQFPDDQGSFHSTMPDMGFTDNGDGTVTVNMPTEFPMQISVRPKDEEAIDIEITYAHTDAVMVVSGDPDDMTNDYSAASVTMALKSLIVDDETVPDGIVNATISLSNVASSNRMIIGDLRRSEQQMSADSANYQFGFKDPDSDDQGNFPGALQNLAFEGAGDIPVGINASDMQALLAAGLDFAGTFAYGAGNSSMSGTGDGEVFGYESQSQGGALGVAMDGSHLSYDISQQGVDMSITSGELPFPLMLSMAELGLNLSMPTTKSDEEQDFAFGFRLTEFNVPDMLWGMFDPAAVMPRDPATIIVDLTGKAKILFDLMDPESAASMGDQPPGELNALTINELQVSAVGAKLDGTGDFIFDNSDLQSFDGMPAPSGEANLSLVGANALVDRLIQMGFMGEEEAMGARMMMGLLAVPGDAPDTLSSKIEINDQGHIIANGQRIK